MSARGALRGGAGIGLALGLALCGGCDRPPERVVLGLALPERDHVAANIAVEEINAAGGIGGARLELAGTEWKFSGQAEPEVYLAWADRLSADPMVLGVIGHSDSASTLAAAALYNQRGIPHVVTIATHPAITRIGRFTYRICPSDADQARILADYAVDDLGARRIVVFQVNDDYGNGLVELFRDEVARAGGEIVATVRHRDMPDAEDREHIAAVLRRLRRESPPDVFVLVQRIEAARFTIDEIDRHGFDAAILGADNLAMFDDLRLLLPPERRVHAVAFFMPDTDDPAAGEFVRKFESRTDGRANYARALTYDAVRLLAEAAGAGGYSRAGVRRHLDRSIEEGRTWTGVAGPFRLNEDRDALRDVLIVELSQSGTRVVKVVEPRPAGRRKATAESG